MNEENNKKNNPNKITLKRLGALIIKTFTALTLILIACAFLYVYVGYVEFKDNGRVVPNNIIECKKKYNEIIKGDDEGTMSKLCDTYFQASSESKDKKLAECVLIHMKDCASYGKQKLMRCINSHIDYCQDIQERQN